MNKFILLGKYTSEFASEMVHTPQYRKGVLNPMFDHFKIKVKEYLYIPTNPDIDFICIVEASDEKTLHGAV